MGQLSTPCISSATPRRFAHDQRARRPRPRAPGPFPSSRRSGPPAVQARSSAAAPRRRTPRAGLMASCSMGMYCCGERKSRKEIPWPAPRRPASAVREQAMRMAVEPRAHAIDGVEQLFAAGIVDHAHDRRVHRQRLAGGQRACPACAIRAMEHGVVRYASAGSWWCRPAGRYTRWPRLRPCRRFPPATIPIAGCVRAVPG